MLEHIHSIVFVNSLCIIRKALPAKNILGPRIISGKVADVWPSALDLRGSKNETKKRPIPNLMSIFSDKLQKLLFEIQSLESSSVVGDFDKSNDNDQKTMPSQEDQKLKSLSQKAGQMLCRLRRFDVDGT